MAKTNKKPSAKVSSLKSSVNKQLTNKRSSAKTISNSRQTKSGNNNVSLVSRISYALFAISLFASLALATAVFRDLVLFVIKYIFSSEKPFSMEFYTYYLAPSMLGIILISSIIYLLVRGTLVRRHPISLPSIIGLTSIVSFYLVFNTLF